MKIYSQYVYKSEAHRIDGQTKFDKYFVGYNTEYLIGI